MHVKQRAALNHVIVGAVDLLPSDDASSDKTRQDLLQHIVYCL